MKKNNNNSNIDGWIRKAFEQAGKQAKEIEQLASNISNVFDTRHIDILDAWAEVSEEKSVWNLIGMAAQDNDYADALDNLMKMGLIAGYVSAIEDMRGGRLKGFV